MKIRAPLALEPRLIVTSCIRVTSCIHRETTKMGQYLCGFMCFKGPWKEKFEKDCDCVRVDPVHGDLMEVWKKESTDSLPTVSEDSSTEEMEGEVPGELSL